MKPSEQMKRKRDNIAALQLMWADNPTLVDICKEFVAGMDSTMSEVAALEQRLEQALAPLSMEEWFTSEVIKDEFDRVMDARRSRLAATEEGKT